MNDENTVLLIDIWIDQKAIDKQCTLAMMLELAKLREKYDLHMKTERFVDAEPTKEDAAFIHE